MIAPAFPDTFFIEVAEKLPAAPRLLIELGQLLQDPAAEEKQVLGLLRRDASLVAGIVRLANSAAYSPHSPIGSLERAVAFVGFAEVHRLVGVVASAQMAERAIRFYPMEGRRLRQHTLFTAVLVEELAVAAREHHPRSCYTAGLLRLIGVLVLENLGHEDPRVRPFRGSGVATLEEWERRNWNLTSAEVAEMVLRHWGMPHETIGAVRHHAAPGARHNPVIHLLRLAVAGANDRLGTVTGMEEAWPLAPENFTRAGVSDRRYLQACARAQEKFALLSTALG